MLFKTKNKFPFNEPKDLVIFTCSHVLEGQSILHVFHDEDGDWQFLCGKEHTTNDARLIAFEEIYKIDSSIKTLLDLERGKSADRKTINDNWIIK